jgi:2-dehydro-3-deoxy-D-arabinonate dehydratase
MKLSRHQTSDGPRWAADGQFLDRSFDLSSLLELSSDTLQEYVASAHTDETAQGPVLAPIEDMQEVWASGVTYQRSREARRAESDMGDVYDRVYAAARPELFFKAIGWRVVAYGQPVRIRTDSAWNVPEPELTLVLNRLGEVVGYTAGNDMSSRSIEGENPLYLPQAKIYNGACALGSEIHLVDANAMRDLPISIAIERNGESIFHSETRISQMNRPLEDLAACLFQELSFPQGVFLMTGTGIVPPDRFTLAREDRITIRVGDVELRNSIGE